MAYNSIILTKEEGVALITTDLSAYHIAGRMHEKGIA